MEEYIYYTELYDFYKNLLTKKQKDYFEDYYFANLSLSEIAENKEISRNAVYRQLKITKNLLEEYEEKLKLKSKKRRIESLLNNNKLSKEIINILDE